MEAGSWNLPSKWKLVCCVQAEAEICKNGEITRPMTLNMNVGM